MSSAHPSGPSRHSWNQASVHTSQKGERKGGTRAQCNPQCVKLTVIDELVPDRVRYIVGHPSYSDQSSNSLGLVRCRARSSSVDCLTMLRRKFRLSAWPLNEITVSCHSPLTAIRWNICRLRCEIQKKDLCAAAKTILACISEGGMTNILSYLIVYLILSFRHKRTKGRGNLTQLSVRIPETLV